jgi:preprotein translocase subunit SecY
LHFRRQFFLKVHAHYKHKLVFFLEIFKAKRGCTLCNPKYGSYFLFKLKGYFLYFTPIVHFMPKLRIHFRLVLIIYWFISLHTCCCLARILRCSLLKFELKSWTLISKKTVFYQIKTLYSWKHILNKPQFSEIISLGLTLAWVMPFSWVWGKITGNGKIASQWESYWPSIFPSHNNLAP